MRMRLHNDDSTDYVDYEGETIDDIREQAKTRLQLPTWRHGWSERL